MKSGKLSLLSSIPVNHLKTLDLFSDSPQKVLSPELSLLSLNPAAKPDMMWM